LALPLQRYIRHPQSSAHAKNLRQIALIARLGKWINIAGASLISFAFTLTLLLVVVLININSSDSRTFFHLSHVWFLFSASFCAGEWVC
jgi:hypothetical protein